MIPLSILDLAPIGEGQSINQAIAASREMAIMSEKAGFKRYWLAEHHGMRGVASSATALMLAQAGMATSTIRIGSGGVMLPNHAPLMVAEQFGTLAAMFADRVDLGLGRAPGTDSKTSQALRRPTMDAVEHYPEDIELLQRYLAQEGSSDVLAVPGVGSHVPLWLLGSSLYSARLASEKGLPFAYASHFAPDYLTRALELYRRQFTPSSQLDMPYTMAGVMAVVADTNAQAQHLFSSAKLQFLHLRRGLNQPFPAPVDDLSQRASAQELLMVEQTLRYALVGSVDQVNQQLQQFIRATGVDELIISVPIHDLATRLETVAQLGQFNSH
ncbi:LLM class flavin-dependent oxidoreductase [Celerinatantimonas yamalensis]|uniref:LLM class flavin-dependent oxidoreductase n=1 Tax=Celerinatantimonas yamalensis TaxID=559956 RepID=A0ABW9G254_9GAMM